jgi:hypothetical protein
MLDKTARKPSADPVQEKLRQDKANWNKETSLFINKVLHFKKLMNGAPNLFFKQKSKITQPIPSNPTSILSSLTTEFQELAQNASGIVEEQLNYAKNHRPKQPKAPAQAPSPSTTPTNPAAPDAPAVPNLSKQLAAWEQKYDLISEGSNPISRFVTRRITRTRGTSERFRINRMRLDMLTSCAKARKALGRLQVEITKGSKGSIVESHKIMQHVWNEWAVVARSFNNYKTKLKIEKYDNSMDLPTDEAMDPKRETLPDQPPDEKHDILSEPPKNVTPPLTAPIVTPLAKQPVVAPPAENVDPEIAELVKKYEVPPKVPEPQSKVAEQLEVVSQAFVKKWLGKKRHQFFSQNTSSYRLEIFEIAKSIRVELNKIMNVLEKGLNVDQLDPLISQVNKQITSLRMLMRSLHLSEKPDASASGQIF